MVVTRSKTRKQNQDDCSRRRAKTLDDGGSPPWSSLNDGILFLIILRLGVYDFFAFSGVCKWWRSVALSNRNVFMASRQPMSLSFSTVHYKKDCCLEDSERRKFKTNLPHFNGRIFVGSTSGYIILFGNRVRDFWLVNPITRHELRFPDYPFHVDQNPAYVRGVLVFSPSMSGWVFVVARGLTDTISFCLAGKEATWNHLISDFPIHDLHFFQGKIYSLNTRYRLCEVILNPKPKLTPLGIDILDSNLLFPELASCDQNLYVLGYNSKDMYGAIKVDFDQMKSASPIKMIEKYSCFVSVLKSGAPGKVGLWEAPQELYERYGYFHGNDSNNHKLRCLNATMWYFPHDCWNVNRLHE
ncbi:hypothetical protein SSX86_028185 [Deinandra increscens subsp. villosa]|uniref:F-box domain-containing protein n=1 Tax=Deinandra increscens subsp. villosa TaxID=3103831 RepID=A0AAP0CAB4_9ASTR